MEQTTAGVSALARYARAQKSGEQLAAADLLHAGVAFDVAGAAPERALAEARTAYDARHRSARDTGWTTEELRTRFGCRPPAFDAVRPAAWLPRAAALSRRRPVHRRDPLGAGYQRPHDAGTEVRAGTGFTIDSRGSDGETSFSGTVTQP